MINSILCPRNRVRYTLTLKNLNLAEHTDRLLHSYPLAHRNTPFQDQKP
jgi:hypothetical protein